MYNVWLTTGQKVTGVDWRAGFLHRPFLAETIPHDNVKQNNAQLNEGEGAKFIFLGKCYLANMNGRKGCSAMQTSPQASLLISAQGPITHWEYLKTLVHHAM